ncbi:hypothetical protein EAE96_003859 [Botrytis aclada]|nr:hypothetical protein EAE96_003859 [Botrytis aclada]
MDQHSSTNSFGKRRNDDPPRRGQYPLRPEREMMRHQQDSRRDADSYPQRDTERHPRSYYPQKRPVDRYRPGPPGSYQFAPRRVTRQPSRFGPAARETTTQERYYTARTSLSRAAGSTHRFQELDSDPVIPLPVEAAPSPEREEALPSRGEDEYELLNDAGGLLRRFTKKTCEVITETITEYSRDSYMSAIEVLQRACREVALKSGAVLEVHHCWLYWRKKGMESGGARRWPSNPDDVDKEVETYRQLKSSKSDSERAAYSARLSATPVTAESSANAGTTETVASSGPVQNPRHWPQAEKEFLFGRVQARRNFQDRMSEKAFWRLVGAAMREEGYTRTTEECREWFEKHGRRYFKYDESRYFTRPDVRCAIDSRMPNRVMTPEDSPVGDARRRRRGDSQRTGGRLRSRMSMAQSSPRTPKTPKANKPRTSDSVLHDYNSWKGGYRNRDKIAKNAGDHPLELIRPSAGERFELYTTETRETYDAYEGYDSPPSPAASQPGSPLFVTQDEPQTERNYDPSARNSTSSLFSSSSPLRESQSMMPDETSMPEERVESIGDIEPGETITSEERIGSGETVPADENDLPSLQPNETEDVEDGVQWISDEWGFATPPTMRPSELDDIAPLDNPSDFNSSLNSATTNSSDFSTFATLPNFDDSLTSNETVEEDPMIQPSSPSNVESENRNSSESEAQLLREQQERTDLEIFNLRANYQRVKEARDDDRKKLDDTAQEIDLVVLRRAEQLDSKAANEAEMERIEAELEEKNRVKQALSIALEELEFCG